MQESEKPIIYGIIHIGSGALFLRIVEYRGVNDIHVIEEVKKKVVFGEEVFLKKKLSFQSILHLCSLLNGLRQLLSDYKVTEYAVYATAVLREAENRRSILDLIRVHTGFKVHVVDMPQEIYFKHFALHYELEQLNRKYHNSLGPGFLFVDITSGCVGLTAWHNGALRYQHNVHIGTLRLVESFQMNQRESKEYPEVISQYIHAIMSPLWTSLGKYKLSYLVLSGREARFIAGLMNLDMSSKAALVRPEIFKKLYERLGQMSSSQIARVYHVSDQKAESVLPTVHLYWEILQNVSAEAILMMETSFVESVAMYYGALKTEDSSVNFMRSQNLELTRAIASNYYYEPEHSDAMGTYGQMIIDSFRPINGLDDRDVFLLRMSIILHQIGKYVNLLDYNKNSYFLIRGIDIFGLSNLDKKIVACIAYYDHQGVPSDEDQPFKELPESIKMTAAKLVAVFRLAYAMDASRRQKMKDICMEVKHDTLLITYSSAEDTSLETWMFEREAELFRSVFGMDAKLRRR